MTKRNYFRTLFYIVGFFCFSYLSAQVKHKDYQNYQNKFPNDDLVVLKKKEHVKIGIDSTGVFISTEHSEEKLYLNSNALNYAQESVPYSDFYKIEAIEAKTILAGKKKNTEIEVTNFKDKDVLENGIFADDNKAKTFIYPSLQAGAVSYLRYKINIADPRFLSSYFFAGFDPMERCELIIEVDNKVNLAFEYFHTNNEILNYKKTTLTNSTLHSWMAKDISKIKFEEDAPNVKYYVPHIITYVKSYELNGNLYKVLSDVEDLYNWYWGFVNHLDDEDPTSLVNLVDSLVADRKSDLQKVESIYSWVQKNIKYIAFEQGLNGFIPRTASQVYTKRYGDCKDMANVIRSLLKLAGIKSYLTWVGTRDIPYTYKQVPTPAVDNHMIATYIDDGNYYFLDATNQYVPFGLPSAFIQGKEALIGMGENHYEIVKIPEIRSGLNANIDTINLIITNDLVAGMATSHLTGYNAEYLKESIEGLSEKEQYDLLNGFYEKGSNRFQITNYKIVNDNNSIKVKYGFVLDNYLKSTPDDIFLNPHLDKIFGNGTIEPSRNYPIEKGYKSFTRKVVKIRIPENYTVGFVPENKYFQTKDFGFELEYEVHKNEIVLTQELHFNLLVMPKEKFEEWNNMVNLLKNAYNEVISLHINRKQ